MVTFLSTTNRFHGSYKVKQVFEYKYAVIFRDKFLVVVVVVETSVKYHLKLTLKRKKCKFKSISGISFRYLQNVLDVV